MCLFSWFLIRSAMLLFPLKLMSQHIYITDLNRKTWGLGLAIQCVHCIEMSVSAKLIKVNLNLSFAFLPLPNCFCKPRLYMAYNDMGIFSLIIAITFYLKCHSQLWFLDRGLYTNVNSNFSSSYFQVKR